MGQAKQQLPALNQTRDRGVEEGGRPKRPEGQMAKFLSRLNDVLREEEGESPDNDTQIIE